MQNLKDVHFSKLIMAYPTFKNLCISNFKPNFKSYIAPYHNFFSGEIYGLQNKNSWNFTPIAFKNCNIKQIVNLRSFKLLKVRSENDQGLVKFQ